MTSKRHVLARGMLMVVALVNVNAAEHPDAVAEAIKHDDVQAVRALLRQHVNVNAVLRDGTRPLYWAVLRGNKEAVDALIAAGADVNLATEYGVTSLSVASLNGDEAIVTRLLKAGAKPNALLSGGETALMTAARTGSAAVIRSLVAGGADVDAREELRGQTALMWAAAEGNVAAMGALIEAGADMNARTSAMMPPSRSRGLSGAPVDRQLAIVPKRTLSIGKTDVATMMTSRPGDPSFSALLFAVRAGRMDAARELLDHGADPNDVIAEGTNALALAILNAHYELASVLLEYGADPNIDQFHRTALLQVVRARRLPANALPPLSTGRMNSMELAAKLVEYGVDVNAAMSKDFQDGMFGSMRLRRIGMTAFLLAARNADPEMMRFLLENGADPRVKTADGVSALALAAGVGLGNPAEDPGSRPEEEPDAIVAIRLCLDLGMNVNDSDVDGETALHGAAYKGANGIARLLVDSGSVIDSKNVRGMTPLNIADGAFFTETLKRQPQTAAFIRSVLKERGLPVPAPPTQDELAAQVK